MAAAAPALFSPSVGLPKLEQREQLDSLRGLLRSLPPQALQQTAALLGLPPDQADLLRALKSQAALSPSPPLRRVTRDDEPVPSVGLPTDLGLLLAQQQLRYQQQQQQEQQQQQSSLVELDSRREDSEDPEDPPAEPPTRGARCTREKNRAAQQRFRKRQKQLISDLKVRAEQLEKVADEQRRTIEALTKENGTLKEIITAQHSGAYAIDKVAAALLGSIDKQGELSSPEPLLHV